MARCARIRSCKAIYHVMVRGNEKKNIFFDNEDMIKMLEIIMLKKHKYDFEMYAYCLMNNHVHLLINEMESQISEIMKSINVSYAMYFNKKYDRVGYLFQGRFKSEPVDNEAYLLNIVRYIHRNPVNAGLADVESAYIWSSFSEYINPKFGNRKIDSDCVLDLFSYQHDKAIEQFISFSNQAAEQLCMDIEESTGQQKKIIYATSDILALLNDFLSRRSISLDELKNMKGKVKGTVKHEAVKLLKDNTRLSCRDIGKILNLNKSSVSQLN